MTLKNVGIAPNLLMKDIENTAPWVFKGEINTSAPYLAKLVFWKKNSGALKAVNLTDYFYLCMAAHWTTAGTFVPTNVDNQIRESLWRHGEVGGHLERMARITIDSWLWDYSQVTNRKSYNPKNGQVMSTHEGTWLSVAIGAYCALMKNKRNALAEEVAAVILSECDKEEKLLLELREARDHVNFLRSTALMAHNFGDLDRVIDQWGLEGAFKDRIYKLGHRVNPSYSPILAYAGQVNKAFLSVENHRHMSLRQPKCLRRSHKFLVPVGPFMDSWGRTLSELLSPEEKAEVITALFEGYKRQDHAFGYIRAYRGLGEMPERYMPYDLIAEIKKSKFHELSLVPEEEFVKEFSAKLAAFVCPLTNLKF